MFRRQTQLIRIKLHAAFRLIRLNQRFIEALKYIFFTTFTFDNGRSIRSITVENIAKLKEEALHQSHYYLPTVPIVFIFQSLSDESMILLNHLLLVQIEIKTRVIFQKEKE
jgi:hypothetical protein